MFCSATFYLNGHGMSPNNTPERFRQILLTGALTLRDS